MIKTVAVGGPKDGQWLEGSGTLDFGDCTYKLYGIGFGMLLWVYHTDSSADTRAVLLALINRYAQFRDFASGNTLEVINRLADKVQELETAQAGAAAREQNLRDELQSKETARHIGAHAIKTVRSMFGTVGFQDPKVSLEGLTGMVVTALNDAKNVAEAGFAEMDSIRAELKSAGHQHEGRPLSDLVDIAIDTERMRHDESLARIANALNFTFATGSDYDWRVKTILNMLQYRKGGISGVKVGMFIPDEIAEAITDAKASGEMRLEVGTVFSSPVAGSGGGGGGQKSDGEVERAHKRLDTIEKRLGDLEKRDDDASAGQVLDKIMVNRYGIKKR